MDRDLVTKIEIAKIFSGVLVGDSRKFMLAKIFRYTVYMYNEILDQSLLCRAYKIMQTLVILFIFYSAKVFSVTFRGISGDIHMTHYYLNSHFSFNDIMYLVTVSELFSYMLLTTYLTAA